MAGGPENVIDVKTLWKFWFFMSQTDFKSSLRPHYGSFSNMTLKVDGRGSGGGGGITVRHVEIIPHRSHVTCVSFVFGVFSRSRLSLGSVPLCLSKDESVYWGTSLVWDQTLRATDPLLHEEGYCTTRKTRPRRIKKKEAHLGQDLFVYLNQLKEWPINKYNSAQPHMWITVWGQVGWPQCLQPINEMRIDAWAELYHSSELSDRINSVI